MSVNPRSQPILNGALQAEGIDLTCSSAHPSEIFWRQLHFGEFDVSEMSMSSFLILLASGNRDWIGLPVFTVRRFFHTGIWIRTDAGIDRPEDLRGKRVGVPEYQQTAALWCRGALWHEFGVLPSDIEWHMERTEERSHGGATSFRPPQGVRLQRIPPEKNIGSMLLAGELDATLLYIADNNLIDRSRARLEDSPNLGLLFPDPAAEGRRYYAATGLYPINHAVVVRRSIVDRHPWIALNLYNAFQQAKERSLRRLAELAEGHLTLGLLPPEAASALRRDPFPYGVRANRDTLETLASYSHEQGLTPRVVPLDETFAQATLEL